MQNALAAVILTGGQSTRMGQDKARLPLHGKRLIDVIAVQASEAGINALYVSGEMEDYTYITDLIPQCGPVGGICSSVLALENQYKRVLFIPVDLPKLKPELLHLLINQPHEFACYPVDHPLPCILPLNAKTYDHARTCLQTLAAGQKISVRGFLNELGAVTVNIPPALQNTLTNTNTPQQWREATSS